MGDLVPIGLVPVLPGDLMAHQTNTLLRVTPLAAPVMHQVDVRIHHFYCANRTLRHPDDDATGFDWEEFITGGEDGMNTDVIPQVNATGVAGDLLDHLGVSPKADPTTMVNALPLRAANFCFNEFYRDQDLQTVRDLHDTSLPKICWEKDYTGVARPWSQKGPNISIPVGDSANVKWRGDDVAGDPVAVQKEDGTFIQQWAPTANGEVVRGQTQQSAEQYALYADLANAAGVDPIAFREAWGIQRFMEDAARYGSRYPEKMRRLGSNYQGLMDRPEFLAGGSRSISFSEVLQTANGSDPRFGVGDLYGHGIAATRSNKYVRRIPEHGYVLTFLSVRPKNMLIDALQREWLKQDREEFHDPFLEDIGMQPVYNGEVTADHTAGVRNVFGYSDRYEEYRTGCNQVTGEYRDLLNYWHLGRSLTDPVLSSQFVECNPSKRIFNEQTQNSLWIMAHHQIACHRNISNRARTRLL
jgi:hypothetical protein